MVAAINNADLLQRFPELRNSHCAHVPADAFGKKPEGIRPQEVSESPHFRGAKMSEGLRICEADRSTYLHPSFAELVMGFRLDGRIGTCGNAVPQIPELIGRAIAKRAQHDLRAVRRHQAHRPPPSKASLEPLAFVTDAQIAESYARHGNIWKVAEEVGLSGQTVSRRMIDAGIVKKNKRWITERDRELIRSYYTTTPPDIFDHSSFAFFSIGKRLLFCKEARLMGFTTQTRSQSAHQDIHIRHAEASSCGAGTPARLVGMKHTDEAKKVIALKSRQMWAT